MLPTTVTFNTQSTLEHLAFPYWHGQHIRVPSYHAAAAQRNSQSNPADSTFQ